MEYSDKSKKGTIEVYLWIDVPYRYPNASFVIDTFGNAYVYQDGEIIAYHISGSYRSITVMPTPEPQILSQLLAESE